MTECVRVLTVDYLGSVHYLWGGGGLANGRGGQAKFTPLFRGGQKGFALDLGKRGGGQKSLKFDIISFKFFLILPELHDI